MPLDPSRYFAFVVAMFFMAISPGPANLFFIRTGLSGRASRVFAGVLGTNSASLVWLVASALGLQALMTAFPLVFQIVAVLGGLYLGWLGFKTFRKALKLENETVSDALTTAAPDKTPWQTLREGFMVQILNPKMVLFLTAVLTPFLDLKRPMIPQMVLLSATTIAMDVVSMTTYGLLAVRLAHLLHDPHNKQKFDIGAGLILMLVSLLILFHSLSAWFPGI